ncbi:MAG: C39 family peptidase [Treponema sp.]|nr:C39 family peptidase [Treponema sp.]
MTGLTSFIIEIIKILITTFVITTLVDIFLMGLLRWRFSRRTKVSSFFVRPSAKSVKTPSGSYFEFQGPGGCAGFSSAFLLRHLGQAASGEEAYKEVPFTYGNGIAFPKGITGFFKKHGMKVKLYSGNLSALKNELARGNPVIVVIRSFPRKSYLHFACITGYDEENFYLADSILSWVNVDKDGKPIEPSENTVPTSDETVYYNRTVPVKTFRQLWNTSMLKMPLYRNMFFVMK